MPASGPLLAESPLRPENLKAGRYAQLQGAIGRQWAELGAEFSVVHDDLSLPWSATSTAVSMLGSVLGHDRLRTWTARHIRNVRVHCTQKPLPIDISGDTIHFYGSDRNVDHACGLELHGRLSDQQRADYAALCPNGVDPREDFASAFEPRVTSVPAIVKLDRLVFPAGSGGPWNEEKNRRRCELIDKEIDESLSDDERVELEALQQQMIEHRRRVAPLPIEGARKLHRELLAKKRQRERPA